MKKQIFVYNAVRAINSAGNYSCGEANDYSGPAKHPGMDGLDTGRRHEESGKTRGVEGAGCQVICGAPTVH